jgi:hypothetical protein
MHDRIYAPHKPRRRPLILQATSDSSLNLGFDTLQSRGRDVAREGLVTDVWINGDVSGTLMSDADRDTR